MPEKAPFIYLLFIIMGTLEGTLEQFRSDIKKTASEVKNCFDILKTQEADEIEDRWEMMANLMITYRHLEDAAMRIWKVMQAKNGGVSIYDKK